MRQLAAFLALGVVALAAMPAFAAEAITGTVAYRERMALPPGTELEVRLVDVSREGAPTVATTRGGVEGQVPVPFSVSYDPANLAASGSYALTARLLHEGRTLFQSHQPRGVPIPGAGAPVALLLARVPAEPEPDPAADFVGTWIAEEIDGAPAEDGAVSWLELTASGRVQGQGGCNGFTGAWKRGAESLSFGPLASTRKLCAGPAMGQEDRFFAALSATMSARVEDGRLVFADGDGKAVARFRPE